jgi:hypothetical protein
MSRIKRYNPDTGKWEHADGLFVVGGKVPSSIDLSAFETEGKIVERFADGSLATTVMEFDDEGKPVKITDSNGNVTTLIW